MKRISIDMDARYEMIPVLARKLLDVPFRLYGRDPNVGIDCVGVTAIAATQAGFDCPNMLIRIPDANRSCLPPMMGAVEKDIVRVSLDDIRVGDMLFMQPPHCPCRMDHLAVVSNTNPITIIHTDPLFQGAVAEHRLSDSRPALFRNLIGMTRTMNMQWKHWVRAAYRFQRLKVDFEEESAKVFLKSKHYGQSTTVLGNPLAPDLADNNLVMMYGVDRHYFSNPSGNILITQKG